MKVATLERKFKYNSITLPDPSQSLSPDAVREFYAAQYPELASAATEGPTTKDNVATWTFVRAVGSKGRKPLLDTATNSPARAVILRALEQPLMDTTDVDAHSGAHASKLLGICFSRRRAASVLPMPSSAFGIWG
jgi:PRTRC genetic system protein C